jgi:transcriptional regulator with XRE-family HTH domain
MLTVTRLARRCGLSRSTVLYYERNQMVTKEKWVAIMKGCGFTEAQMHAWHVEFERAAPDEHQEFLEFLHIPTGEIQRIREFSRKGATA